MERLRENLERLLQHSVRQENAGVRLKPREADARARMQDPALFVKPLARTRPALVFTPLTRCSDLSVL